MEITHSDDCSSACTLKVIQRMSVAHEVPDMVETAKNWKDFSSGKSNLIDWLP